MEMYKFYWNWRGCWLAFEQGLVGWLNKNVLCSTQPQLRIALLFSRSMITIYPCSQYLQTLVNTTHSFRQTVNRKLWRLASGYICSLLCPVSSLGVELSIWARRRLGRSRGKVLVWHNILQKVAKSTIPVGQQTASEFRIGKIGSFLVFLPGGSWKESLHWLPKNRNIFLQDIKKKKKKETSYNLFVLLWKDRKPYRTSRDFFF